MKHSGWHGRRPPRFGGVLEELESRLLFNADASALTGIDPNTDPHAPTSHTAEVQVQTYAPPAHSSQASSDGNESEMLAATHVVAQPVELIFVDRSVHDANDLIAYIVSQQDGSRALEIHWLDSDQDGVAQITEVLQSRQNVSAVHLITHGKDGMLQLGSTSLDADNLAEHASQLAAWAPSMTEDADLMIYGCDVAASEQGQRFLGDLALLTRTDLAASTDSTGARALGGDWELEFNAGQIEARSLIQHHATNEWHGLLAITKSGSETIAHTATGGTTEATLTNRQVAADSSGNFTVIWTDGTNLKAQRFNADGTMNGGVITVASSGTPTFAQIAMNATGASVITWNDSNGNLLFRTYTNTGVAGAATTVAARTSAMGGAPGYSYTTVTTNVRASVGINSAGEFVVAYLEKQVSTKDYGWSPNGPTTDTIKWKAYTAAGALQGTNGTATVSSTSLGNIDPSVGMNGAGAFVVSYTDSSGNAFVRRYSAARASLAAAGDITGGTGGTQSSAAMDSSGNYVIAYNDAGVIKFRMYNSSGTPTTAVTTANSIAAGTPNSPSVAMDSSGKFTITWQNSGQDGSNNGVYMRQFSSAGVASVADALVNTTTSGNQQYASIASTGEGAVITWSGNGTGDTAGVFFQRYAAVNEAPTLSATGSNPTFTEAVGAGNQAAAVTVYSGASISAIEASQSISSLTFTVSGIVNGASERIVVDGTTITLGADSAGTTSTNSMSYTVTIASGTATIVLTKGAGISTAAAQTLVNGITYQHTSTDNPTAGNRVFTLTQVKDTGGTGGGGVDTTALSVVSTVNVVAVNDNPVISSNGGGASASINVAENATAVTTVVASDPEGTALTYSISGGVDAARFTIHASTGVLTFVSAPNRESPTDSGGNNVYDVIVRASDGSLTDTQTLAITVTDVDEFDVGAVTDSNGASNSLAENSANGSTVGITASASDADATTNTITYSLTDNAGGRFTIASGTGIVTVANASLLNYEAATSHSITVLATSADGSTSSQSFTINLTDVDEFNVGAVADTNAAANTLAENTANGTAVGITASASDADATTNTITYSLTDAAGGRFTIDGSTGVVTVADGSLLNYESATSHNITVRATSADGSTSDQVFTVNLTDVDEFNVGAVSDSNGSANSVAENVANGATVGLTASASDADGTTNTIIYSLTDTAGGRFTIHSTTGVVTVADGSLLNYESATSHNITVLATSADGSSSSQSFTINVSDVDEFNVGAVTDVNGAANSLAENSVNGTAVGITASASDADGSTNTITYSLTDSAGGRFTIGSGTGIVTVANSTLLNYEGATSHNITVLATSADGSTSSQSFTIALTDVDEFDVGAVGDGNGGANSVAENAANGSTVGLTASATDADGTNSTITYSLTDTAGGRFTIHGSTGVVTVANGTLLNYESATSHNITVLATSADGSSSSQSFTINIADIDEFNVGAVTDTNGAANSLAENSANGTAVGITASASDADGSTNTITYSLTDSAGGRFTVHGSTGIVTVADGSLLNFEAATSHNITVLATSADGSTSSQSFTISLTDVDEFNVGAVTDTDGAANSVAENASDGDGVGITASASDADASNNTITYSLSNDAGGRFTIDSSTGVVTVADADLLDFETNASHDITVLATSADGSSNSQIFTIQIGDVSEVGVGAISDTDGGANTVAENAANGTAVGLTAFANDPDVFDTVTYTLSDSAGGRFAIDLNTGVVTVADGSLLDREAAASHNITVLATSTDTTTTSRTFTISLTDLDEFNVGAVTDGNVGANVVVENAVNGSLVGLTATASDLDATNNTITYTLSDSAGGRFTIHSSTGVVSVADGTLLNYEAATSHDITVVATSSDGSSNNQTFTINLSDANEFDVGAVSDINGAANTIAENTANGSTVGITASASDADATTNTITYSLTDSAGGRFTIDGNTGIVTVADDALLNYESATSHNIIVRATSADGSTSDQSFTITLTDVDEFNVGAIADADVAANSVAENASNGTTVGVTASASDADGTTNAITYSLTDTAGGRFTIDGNTGVVTVANGSLLDREAASTHDITVRATSADGSTSDQTFTINLSDVDEFNVGVVSDGNGVANSVVESAANGTTVGITASASDADSTTNAITYSLSDDAGGRFAINAGTGVVTVADGSQLNYEAATSHSITVRATSADGSTSEQSFTVNLTDANEFNVGAAVDTDATANSVAENAANGTTVGITATATDADGTTNTVTYALTDDAGGRFAIDTNTGVVTVADGSLLNREASASHNITVRATSADGSTSDEAFTINIGDVDEFNVGAVSDTDGGANTVAENAASGTTVGVTASATDADSTTNVITYSLSDDAGGRFTIDASTGVVTVADGTLLDHEAATSHNITVLATSADGSTSSESFTINLSDVDEFNVGAVTDSDATANSVAENAANGTAVGITASATDADSTTNTITYSLTDSAGGRFTIDANTGVVTVADGSLLDREAASTHDIIVRATSADGSTSDETFTISLTDNDEFNVGAVSDSNVAANTVVENAANGSTVGITASATDADATTNAITYSLTDDAGGRFTIDASTGIVTVADGSLLNYEAATSHNITVLATSVDGSTNSETFTVNLSDADEFDVGALSDTDMNVNAVDENAANGTEVGITASASDADGTTNTITYSLSDDAGGRFTIDANTGVVTVADGSLLNREAAASHDITIVATSADGSSNSEVYTISLDDVDEFDVGAVADSDAAANAVAENAANGTVVGVSASASDADATHNTITYTLADDAGGRFAIDATTGVVTVADGSLLNREAAASHDIIIVANSADGSTSNTTITIQISDVDEFDVGTVSDIDGTANTIAENSANGTAVGITASATDADSTTNTITYSLSDDAGGRFTIDASTGVVTVANSTLLNHEADTSHNITVLATSADGSTSSASFTINLSDVDEFDVGAVTDTNGTANTVNENAANGTAVGITASATDADSTTNTVTYSLSDNAGGRFTIDAVTGVVTVADGSLLNRETAASHDITVLATSADGSTNSATFTINLGDVDEFDVGAVSDANGGANTVAENAANGTTVGITASAADADSTINTITYTLSDDAGGRFTIDASTGVVTVANSTLLNHEDTTSHNITVLATSADGSTSSASFTINLSDVDEFDVGAVTDTNGTANTVAENAANGSAVGITASATDADSTTNTVTYSLSDNAGGRFTIDASTGIVTVANSALLNYEAATSHSITITATSADGSTSSQTFTISLSDINEFNLGAISDGDAAADTVAENAANGTTLGITASATDADGSNNTVAYTLTDDAGGRFAIDGSTGVVTVANGNLLDFETSTTHQITVQAFSADGSSSSRNYTINLLGVNDNTPEWAMAQTEMQVAERTTFVTTLAATDADLPASTLSFSIVGGGDATRFTLNSSTGALSFNAMPNYMAPLDANGDNRYEVMVRVSDGVWSRDVMLRAEVTDQPEPYVPPPAPPSTNDGRPSTGGDNTATPPKPAAPPAPAPTPAPAPEPGTQPDSAADNATTTPPTLEEVLAGDAATNPNNSAADAILGYAPTSAGSAAAARAADAAALRNELARFQLNLNLPDFGTRLNWLMPDMSIQVLTTINESLNPISPLGIPASGLTTPDTLSFVDSKDDDSGPMATNLPQAMKASGMAMTLGTIWWASRASGLIASMMVSAPAWRGIDPLPVLFDRPEGEGVGPEGGEEPRDEDALAEQMFDNRTRSALDAASIG